MLSQRSRLRGGVFRAPTLLFEHEWRAREGLVEAASARRVVHVVEALSEHEVRATLARDPWSGSHLEVDTIYAWTIRLDGR